MSQSTRIIVLLKALKPYIPILAMGQSHLLTVTIVTKSSHEVNYVTIEQIGGRAMSEEALNGTSELHYQFPWMDIDKRTFKEVCRTIIADYLRQVAILPSRLHEGDGVGLSQHTSKTNSPQE